MIGKGVVATDLLTFKGHVDFWVHPAKPNLIKFLRKLDDVASKRLYVAINVFRFTAVNANDTALSAWKSKFGPLSHNDISGTYNYKITEIII